VNQHDIGAQLVTELQTRVVRHGMTDPPHPRSTLQHRGNAITVDRHGVHRRDTQSASALHTGALARYSGRATGHLSSLSCPQRELAGRVGCTPCSASDSPPGRRKRRSMTPFTVFSLRLCPELTHMSDDTRGTPRTVLFTVAL